MNEAKGRAGKDGSPAGRFTPPKGYGGFIPVLDDVAEGEWTLGVASAPPSVPAARSSGIAEAPRPERSVRPVSEAPAVGASRADRKTFSEIPLQLASAGSQRGVLGDIQGTEPPPPPPLRHVTAPPTILGDIQGRELPSQPSVRHVAAPPTILGDIRGRELPLPPPVRRVVVPPAVSPAPRRRSTVLWLVVILLVLGLAGETWYGLGVIRQHNIQLSPVSAVEQAASGLVAKLRATESRLSGLWNNRSGKAADAAQPSGQVVPAGAGNVVRPTAAAATTAPPPPVQKSQENPLALPTVSANPEARAELQVRLPRRTRPRLATQDKHRRVQVASSVSSNRAAKLHRNVAPVQAETPSPPRQFDRPRVDFEVAKNSSREIVPGISLRITATNVGAQRYDGYLWLMSEGKALWLSNVGVQRPIVFYPRRGGQADQIIVTRVTRNSVVGYLLQPVSGVAGPG